MPSNYFVSGYDLTLRAINLVNDTTPFYKVIFSKYIRQLMITPEIHRIHILYNSRIAFWNPWDCLRLNDESSVDVINAAHIVLLAADSYLMEAKRGILGEHHHSALACKAALRFVEKLRQQERYRTDTVKILTKVLRFWDIPHED
jgi:hypothetical protein